LDSPNIQLMFVQEIRNDTLGGGFKSYSPLLWEDSEIDKCPLLPTNQEIQFKECCNRDTRMTLPDQFSGKKTILFVTPEHGESAAWTKFITNSR